MVAINNSINAGGGTTTTLLHGNATGAPSYTAISLSTDSVTGALGIANGGTNANSQITNGINYFNGSGITSASFLTFDGASTITLTNSTPATSLILTTNSTSSACEALIILNRGGSPTSGYAQIHLRTNGVEDWAIGTRTGSSNVNFTYYGSSTTVCTLDTSGNLTTVGTLRPGGQTSGGIMYYDGTQLISNSRLVYTTTSDTVSIISALANPQIAISTSYTSSTATTSSASLELSAADTTYGGTYLYHAIGGNTLWQNGTYPNSSNYVFSSHGYGNALTLNYTTGKVNIATLSASQVVLTDASNNLTSSSTLSVGNGGTGISTGTSGGIPYFSSTSTMASSAALTNHALVLGGGAGASPTSLGLGTTTTVLHGNASGAPTFGAVVLTTDVSGTLPVGNGGTGITTGNSGGIPYFTSTVTMTSSATLTANALVLGGGVGTSPTSLGLGTTTTVLHGNASGAPTFGAVVLTTDVSGTLPVGNGGTGTSTTFTQGSVVFAGASGVYSQNNSDFYWDNTNFALSIGTNSNPTLYSLNVVNNSTIYMASFQTNIISTLVTGFSILAPNIPTTSGGAVEIMFGVVNTTYSLGVLSFNYNSTLSGSSVTLGVRGYEETLRVSSTTVTLYDANLAFQTAGYGLRIIAGASGSGARMGTATLTGTTAVVIANTTVTANTFIFISRITASATTGTITYTLTAGTSFSIKSSVAADTSTVNYLLIEGV